MKKKLNCVLLIDDDDNCNFYHARVLKKVGCAEKIEVATDGKKGLDLLHSLNDKPDIIFLDINMPVMNGWEFLSEYESLLRELNQTPPIIILSTSINPDDIEKANTFKSVKSFHYKFLDESKLRKILHEFFPGYQA